MMIHFIRCSDRCYQAFCPHHEREDQETPSCFWDVVQGTIYCPTCGYAGQLEVLAMPGLTPPEFFSMQLEERVGGKA